MQPTDGKARPVYAVSEPAHRPADQVVAAITGPSGGLAELGALLRRLVPTTPAQPPPPHPVPTEIETMLERLLSTAPAPGLSSRAALMDIETMLQRLLPVAPTQAPRSGLVTDSRDWDTIVCFFSGKPGHGVGRCPQLDNNFLTCCWDGRLNRWEISIR